ncbi:hypothetical protein BDN70DRAFT_993210 [Pholiota conissans]|uniref:NACHT domain-containing protein n=1 Tax=Pholiota conissans TaxID=109636 RepID=A0A9P5Z1L0_9AGAR|nr:hypothetical protein BDN70DRAFT_993210 [Pholiota conissans]
MAGMSLFEKAEDVYVERGAAFNAVNGDLIQYNVSGDLNSNAELGLSALSNAMSGSALHDAIGRSPPPKCHPGTRLELLETIKLWVEDPDPSFDVLWLYGTTGVGKTAIAQSMAEWAAEKNRMAGTFFFLGGNPEREEARFLFPTLAYQFAMNIPGLRVAVDTIMSKDLTLPSKDLDTQLRMLMLQPFQKMRPIQSYLVIIDGLDECKTFEAQRAIIRAVNTLVGTSNVPLRFFITSRPEAHIREAFNEINQLIRRIYFDGSFEADRDIRIYLQDGFSGIAKKGRILQPWPSQVTLDELVRRSSGQFIYADTVLKFVDADLRIPTEQLDIVLQSAPTYPNLFKGLDDLYTKILMACPYQDDLFGILSLMVAFHCPQPPEVYEDLLDMPRGRVSYILQGMHSLIKFPDYSEDEQERKKFYQRREYDQTCGLRLHHASFGDFLVDPSRSKKFSVNTVGAHIKLSEAAIQLLIDSIGQSASGKPSKHPCLSTWGYLKTHLSVHFLKCSPSERLLMRTSLEDFKFGPGIADLANDFSLNLCFDGLHTLVTFLMKLLVSSDVFPTESFRQVEHSHWTQDVTFESILPLTRDSIDEVILRVAVKYLGLLNSFYHSVMSKYKDMAQLLSRFPGLSLWKDPIPVDYLEDIFGIPQTTMLAELEKNGYFFYRWQQLHYDLPLQTLDVVMINPHTAIFLSDTHSGTHYQDIETRHIYAFQNFIKLILSSTWLQTQKRMDNALKCLDEMLKFHLNSINIDPSSTYSDSHPIIGLIKYLQEIVYDYSSLENAPTNAVKSAWAATRVMLDWIQRQRSKTERLDDNNASKFDEILILASTHIYHQILWAEPCERGQERITLREPFSSVASPRTSMSPSSTSDDAASGENDVDGDDAGFHIMGSNRRISGTLLALHGVRLSLLEFLTSATYAGPLYIPALEYHTQLAEICLDHCDPPYDITDDWRTIASFTEWRFHLIRARPSRRLMERLLTLQVGAWLAEGSPTNRDAHKEVKINSVNAIIEWLAKWPDTPKDVRDLWMNRLKVINRVRPLLKKQTRAFR